MSVIFPRSASAYFVKRDRSENRARSRRRSLETQAGLKRHEPKLFFLISFALVVGAILLSILSANDTDLVPKVRRFFADDVVTIRERSVDRSLPIDLPAPDGEANYATFDIDFTPGPLESYRDLLQTAPLSLGFRIETSGATLVATVATDSKKKPAMGLTLTSDLQAGQHYRVRITYIERSVSTVMFRDPSGHWTSFPFTVGHVNLTAPLFGGGFLPERSWSGSARLRSYSAGRAISHEAAESLLGMVWLLGSSLLLGAVIWIWSPLAVRMTQETFAGLDRLRARPHGPAGHAGDLLSAFRLLAFAAVALGHGVATFTPEGLADTLRGAPGMSLVVGGPMGGIWMFFVLSGYLMGKGFWAFRYDLDRPGLFAFFNNRMVKLLPAYLATFLFYGVIRYPEVFSIENMFVVFRFLIFDYTAPFDCKPLLTLWSISTEVQFYMIAPVLTCLVFKASSSFRSFVALVAVLLFGGVGLRYALTSAYGMGNWSAYVYAPLYGNLDLFCLGIAAAAAAKFMPETRLSGRVWTAIGAACAALTYAAAACLYAWGSVVVAMNVPGNWTPWLGQTIVGLLSAVTILALEWGHAHGGSRMPKPLVRSLALVGALTYPLYLWFEPVLNAFGPAHPAKGDLFTVFPHVLVTLAVTFLFALFTYIAIEVPAERWRRAGRRSSKRGVPASLQLSLAL